MASGSGYLRTRQWKQRPVTLEHVSGSEEKVERLRHTRKINSSESFVIAQTFRNPLVLESANNQLLRVSDFLLVQRLDLESRSACVARIPSTFRLPPCHISPSLCPFSHR
jgi:hypothetical protein